MPHASKVDRYMYEQDVGIEQLNLFSARSTDDLISEAEAAIFHRRNERWKIAHR
jgi:hypothetical protein